jgi:glycosyltransferase involved in cell wall biosynthesis
MEAISRAKKTMGVIARLSPMAVSSPVAFIKKINTSDVRKFFTQLITVNPALLEEKVKRKAWGRVLVIDRSLPAYDMDAGSLRMYHLLVTMVSLGFKVTFLPDDLVRLEPYASELNRLGIEVLHGGLDIERYLKKEGGNFPYILVSRPGQAFKFIPLVRACSRNSWIIYDTVDLQWLRFERGYKVTGDKELLEKAKLCRKMEFMSAARSDIVITVSEDEKRILEAELPGIRVEVIPTIHPLSDHRPVPFHARRDLMFIGGYLHEPNRDAVFYFTREILPLVKERIPGIKFFVVGSNPPPEILALNSPDVVVTGYVRDVGPYFERCRVFVSPLRYGAGVKGKIGQSMAFGLPVVTTPVGAEGLGLINSENALIANGPEDFAAAVHRLYMDMGLWSKLSSKSVEHVRENYSVENIRGKISRLFA